MTSQNDDVGEQKQIKNGVPGGAVDEVRLGGILAVSSSMSRQSTGVDKPGESLGKVNRGDLGCTSISGAEGFERKRRFGRTVAANLFGQLVTVGTTVLGVPVFLASWGAELYGDWLIVASIPILVGQACGAFSSSGGTEMIIRRHEGREVVSAIFASSMTIIIAVSALIVLLGSLAGTISIISGFEIGGIGNWSLGLLVIVLSAQVAMHLFLGGLVSGFRSIDRFATGFVYQHAARGVAFLAGVVVLSLGGRPVVTSVGMYVGQTAVVIIAASSLFRKAPWLLYDLGRVDRVEVSRLLRITVADMSDPFASAIRQQYPVLVAGWFGSSMDVVVVSSVRTLASLVVQASRIVNRAIQQELSVVVGEGRFELVAKISRHLLQYSLIASGLISIPLFLGTDFIFRVWTAGEVRPDYVLVGLMLASTCIHSIVLAGGTVLRSANLHARFAIEFLVSVVAGFAAALTLVGFLGVHGIALSAVLSDLMLLGFVSWSLRAVIPRLGLRRQS